MVFGLKIIVGSSWCHYTSALRQKKALPLKPPKPEAEGKACATSDTTALL